MKNLMMMLMAITMMMMLMVITMMMMLMVITMMMSNMMMIYCKIYFLFIVFGLIFK
jgi:hypothetical protein